MSLNSMPPAGGRRGERKKNPLWALLTSCTSCKSGQTPGEVTIQDAPAKATSSRKKGRNKRRKQKAQDADTVSAGSWDTIDGTPGPVDVHVDPQHAPVPSGSSVDPLSRDLGNGIHTRGAKVEASPLLKSTRYKQVDAGVQTEGDGSSDEKENRHPHGQRSKRKTKLSPRTQRRLERQESDDEEYASDRSDGRSSPKRRRRRKYSDVVRVERIFIEKNTHTKEEVIIDKLRKRKSKSKEALNYDSDNPLEISNYDSESEVPLNRSHRIASQLSLNKDADNSGSASDMNVTGSSSEDKGTNTDPKKLPHRLILQHVHYNTFETSASETVSGLPPSQDSVRVLPEQSANVLTNVGPEGTSVDMTDPATVGMLPTDAAHAPLSKTESGDKPVLLAGTDLQSMPLEGKTSQIDPLLHTGAKLSEEPGFTTTEKKQLLSQDQVFVAESIPQESFQDKVSYAKVERSPTLERKAIMQNTSSDEINVATIEKSPRLERKAIVLDSNLTNETVSQYEYSVQDPSHMVHVENVPGSATQKASSSESLPDDTSRSTQVAVISPVGPVPMDLENASTSKDSTGIFFGAEGSQKADDNITVKPSSSNSGVQTQNMYDFSPAVVYNVEGALDQEQSKLYEIALPGTVHVVPGDVTASSHVIAGMCTHEPTVMKAGKTGVAVQNIPSVVDQSTSTDHSSNVAQQGKPKENEAHAMAFDADIDGYDSFKADLHARAGIIESSSIEDLTDGLNRGSKGIVKIEETIDETPNVPMTTQPADASETRQYPANHKDASASTSGKPAKHKVFTKKRKKKSRRAISDPLGGRVLLRAAPELPVFIPKIFTESIPSEEDEVTIDPSRTEEERYPKFMAGANTSSPVPAQLTIDDLDRRHRGRRRGPVGAESDSQGKQMESKESEEKSTTTYTTSEMQVEEIPAEQISHLDTVSDSKDQSLATARSSVIPTGDSVTPLQSQVYQQENALSTVTEENISESVTPENTEFTSESHGTSEKLLVGSPVQIVSTPVKVQTSDCATQSDPDMVLDKPIAASEAKTTQTTYVIVNQTEESSTDKAQDQVSLSHGGYCDTENTETETYFTDITDSTYLDSAQIARNEVEGNVAQVLETTSIVDGSTMTTEEKYQVDTKTTQTQKVETSDSGNDADNLVTETTETQTAQVEVSDSSAQGTLTTTESEAKTTQTPVVTLSDASTDGSLDSLDRYGIQTEGKTTQTYDVSISEISDKDDVTTEAKMTQTKRVEFSDAATESSPELEYTSGADDSAYQSARESTLEDKGSQTVSQSDDTDEDVPSYVDSVALSDVSSTTGKKPTTYVSYENIDISTPMTKWYLANADGAGSNLGKETTTDADIPGKRSVMVSDGSCQVGRVESGKDAVTETPIPVSTKEEIAVEEFTEIEILNGTLGDLGQQKAVMQQKQGKVSVSDSASNTHEGSRNIRRKVTLQVTRLAPIDIEPDEVHKTMKQADIQRDGYNEDTLDDISLISDRADSGYYQLQSLDSEPSDLTRDPNISTLPTKASVTVITENNQDRVHTLEDHSAEITRPLSVDVTTSQLDHVRSVECESSQMSPMSVNSDRQTTSSSSREFSPENDNQSEDDYPVSPLPLDERPERRLPEGESPSYKKVRISSVEPGELELASDKLPTVVESFAEGDSMEDWRGSFTQREDRYEIRERRQGVTTYSGDYSSNDDVIKPVIEDQQQKSVTIKRTDSGSPKQQRRRFSPMRSRKPQRRYVISSDDSSESESEEDQPGMDEYGDHLTVTQFRERSGPVGKSPSTPMTPSQRSIEGMEDNNSASATPGKYQWPQHGQHDGAFHGDTEQWRHHSFNKEARLDQSHSEYGSMGDDAGSTDDSVLDRSDDQMLDKQLSYLNDAQLAWNVPPRTPSGQPLTPRMVFTTDDGTQILVRSPPDGMLSPANVKSPRTALTPKDRDDLLKEIPYEKLDTLVQKVLMAYVDRCAFLESKLFELQKDRDGLNSDNQSLHESWMEMRRRMSLMEIEIEIMRKELVYHSAWRTTINFHPRHIGNHPCISARHTRLFPRI